MLDYYSLEVISVADEVRAAAKWVGWGLLFDRLCH